MRVQVAIIGGGPSGLLLAQLLRLNGVESIVVEKRPMEHVIGRVRAGVLEQGTVNLLEEAKAADRLLADGLVHGGLDIVVSGSRHRIDLASLTGGSKVTIYGQTEVTRDLYAVHKSLGGQVIDEAEAVALHDIEGDRPFVSFRKDGKPMRIDCDFIAGCDGFHGVSRPMLPASVIREYEHVYPYSWVGLLSATPPVSDELIYIRHPRGFALCSMRSHELSRYYLQCPPTDTVADWPDQRFWSELRQRLPEDEADALISGAAIEKSVVPMRSYVAEPMQHGRLFLAGDAAHIVPPTGAKGLNLAASDVHYLARALIDHYSAGESSGLRDYSRVALNRVWQCERFSWWMTSLLHTPADSDEFEERVRRAELNYVLSSSTAQASLAENYVGLPY